MKRLPIILTFITAGLLIAACSIPVSLLGINNDNVEEAEAIPTVALAEIETTSEAVVEAFISASFRDLDGDAAFALVCNDLQGQRAQFSEDIQSLVDGGVEIDISDLTYSAELMPGDTTTSVIVSGNIVLSLEIEGNPISETIPFDDLVGSAGVSVVMEDGAWKMCDRAFIGGESPEDLATATLPPAVTDEPIETEEAMATEEAVVTDEAVATDEALATEEIATEEAVIASNDPARVAQDFIASIFLGDYDLATTVICQQLLPQITPDLFVPPEEQGLEIDISGLNFEVIDQDDIEAEVAISGPVIVTQTGDEPITLDFANVTGVDSIVVTLEDGAWKVCEPGLLGGT